MSINFSKRVINCIQLFIDIDQTKLKNWALCKHITSNFIQSYRSFSANKITLMGCKVSCKIENIIEILISIHKALTLSADIFHNVATIFKVLRHIIVTREESLTIFFLKFISNCVNFVKRCTTVTKLFDSWTNSVDNIAIARVLNKLFTDITTSTIHTIRYTLLCSHSIRTNKTVKELLKLLIGGNPATQARFTAVGDDDQSIYGWRGATLDNLRKLPIDFPSLKVVKLEQNYRSTGAILRAANHVIGPNPKLFPKNLWSDLGEGEPVRVVDADSEEHEAERTVARIQSLRAGTQVSSGPQYQEFKDFAILYRANHQAKTFEKALRKAQIPYKVSGGTSFFDRAEIKDLCGWLRLWLNPDDDPAFLRAVTVPKRGIGHQTLQQLGTFASRYRISLFEALFAASLGSVLSGKAIGSLHEFGRYVNDLSYRARHTSGAEAAAVFLRDWLKEIDYEKHLYDGEDSAALAAARWTNVLDFCDWMSARCGGQISDVAGVSTAGELKSLLEVAQTVSLISTLNEREKDQNVVTLSTLHAAKGLEWPHVMLVGVTEGMLPFRPGEDAPADEVATRLEEERRLMYVGITRAQRSLAVSWSRRRKKGRELVAVLPSRFIAEMALDAKTVREDPREKLRALRAEFAQRAQDNAAALARIS